MLLFIPRSLCALKRVVAKGEHPRYGATQGIRIAVASGLFRAEASDGRRALVVQGMLPTEAPPWPGFKELPDDAFETIVLPKDLERACKLGDWLQDRFKMVGLATMGNDIFMGLGNDLINTRIVEGKFPPIDKVIPKKKPLFSFRFDPKTLAETLLAIAELLPETDRAVQFFYYGKGQPLAFCAKNFEANLMIDALVVPFTEPDEKPKAEAGKPEAEKGEDAEQEPKRRGKKTVGKPAAEGQTTTADESQASSDPVNLSPPTSQQYEEAKARHPDMVLLFRVGDFYHLVDADAARVATALGLTLTTSDGRDLAGFPHHQLETYLRKLLAEGHRVAICDQADEKEVAEPTKSRRTRKRKLAASDAAD